MKMKMTVEHHDGQKQTYLLSPLAIIGWEKFSGRKMADLASDHGGMGMTDMARMTWEQARLEGVTDEFEAWVSSLADISPEETPDPQPGGEAA